jgi:hypothetical protein
MDFAIVLQMSLQRGSNGRQRRLDKVLIAVVGGLWAWKILETAGRQSGLLQRNLGWGFVVDLTIPLAATAAVAAFFIARWAARRVARRKT